MGAGPHGHQKPGTSYGLGSQRAALSARWSRQVRARTGRAPVADQPPRKTFTPGWRAHADEKAPDLTTASPTPGLALRVQGRNPPAWRRLATPFPSRVGVSRGGGAGAPAPGGLSFGRADCKGASAVPPAGGLPWRLQAAAFDPGRARALYGTAQTGVPLDAATASFLRHATAGCDRGATRVWGARPVGTGAHVKTKPGAWRGRHSLPRLTRR